MLECSECGGEVLSTSGGDWICIKCKRESKYSKEDIIIDMS